MRRAWHLGWLVLCMAPTCQETNPAFLGAAEATGAATGDDGAVTSTTTQGADDAPMTGATTAAASTGADSGTPATDTASGGGSSETAATGGDTGSSSTGEGASSSGGTGCAGMLCPDGCVDVQTDPDNCGICGNKCHPVMEQCVMGECVDN